MNFTEPCEKVSLRFLPLPPQNPPMDKKCWGPSGASSLLHPLLSSVGCLLNLEPSRQYNKRSCKCLNRGAIWTLVSKPQPPRPQFWLSLRVGSHFQKCLEEPTRAPCLEYRSLLREEILKTKKRVNFLSFSPIFFYLNCLIWRNVSLFFFAANLSF